MARIALAALLLRLIGRRRFPFKGDMVAQLVRGVEKGAATARRHKMHILLDMAGIMVGIAGQHQFQLVAGRLAIPADCVSR